MNTEKIGKLSIWKRIILFTKGYVFIRYEKREGWKGFLPIYLVKCKIHGLFTDYPHGFNENFSCPDCLKECLEEQEREECKSIIQQSYEMFIAELEKDIEKSKKAKSERGL